MDVKIAQSEQKTQDAFWQYVRGICILCVVLIHSKSVVGYETGSSAAWAFNYCLILRQFIDFPVAIFIFLSGYFTNIEITDKSILSYIFSRLKRLFIPYLIWSTLYSIINIVLAGGNVNILKVIIDFLSGQSSGQLYFVLVLLQLTIITPFLIKTIRDDRWRKILFSITPVYLLGLYLYAAVFKKQLPYYQALFPAWFGFYYVGLWIKIKGFKPSFRKQKLIGSIILCLAALLFSIIEGFGLLALDFPEGFAVSQIKISSFLYVFAIINLLFTIKSYAEKIRMTPLKVLGDNSYGIYYVHMVWMIISTKVLSSISVFNDCLPLYQLIQVAFVIIFSCISIFITKKIIGRKISGKLLGF